MTNMKPQVRVVVESVDDARRAFEKIAPYLSAVVAKDVTIASTGVPTDAELDAAFGTPAEVGDGFHALVDEGGAGTVVYPVYAKDGVWYYGAALTAAV